MVYSAPYGSERITDMNFQQYAHIMCDTYLGLVTNAMGFHRFSVDFTIRVDKIGRPGGLLLAKAHCEVGGA
jgi:hypothetical protein